MSETELQPLVTRCPDCATQFKVSEAQLQVANGKVRCGSCLAVFEGVDNLVWDSEFDENESADVTLDDLLDELKDDVATTTSTELLPAEDLINPPADEDEGNANAPQLETDEQRMAPVPTASSADEVMLGAELDEELDFDRDLAASQIIQAADAQTEPDLRFALEHIAVPPEEELLDLGPSYVGPDYAGLTRSPAHQAEAQQRSRNRREAMAEMRALAEQREAQEAAAPIDETQIADTPPSVPAVTDADLQTASTSAYPEEKELEQVWERKPDPAPQAVETSTQASEPEAASAGSARSWRMPLVAAALVLLVAQVMYLQFDDWAVDPSFRPAYAAACTLLPCELPDRRALELLKSRALKVRSHPEDEGALLVAR